MGNFTNQDTPIKPWDWNLPLELFIWGFVIFLVVGIWVWTRAGVDRRNTPDILGRNVEDFAGVTQEGNGPVPIFLLLLYATIALFILAYPAITLIFGYNY